MPGRRVARALLATWLYGAVASPAAFASDRPVAGHAHTDVKGLVVEPTGVAGSDDTAAASGGSTGSCPTTVSCGFRCTAELASGFCARAVDWEGKAKIGGIQIGPTIKTECNICECWYIYMSSNGNQIFKRTTKLGCTVSFPGLETHVE